MHSYQVLARKYRPQSFAQILGQEHVVVAIENSLKLGRLHHAYLFSGTRGVGKTSLARLFAKALNCSEGISAEPCEQCENCTLASSAHHIDVIEIDAASRTKVEDTRELLDNVQYKPSLGRFKIYIIDEVHMLSRHSFNALLKTLEEPPSYVKFLLATTDPQKLPITILSRCIQFHLRALESEQIYQHLCDVLTQEALNFEHKAVALIAKKANGSIRDALSLTDQAIALGAGAINYQATMDMLGVIDDKHSYSLIQALKASNVALVMEIIEAVASQGVDWHEFLAQLIETIHSLSMIQLLGGSDESLLTLAQQIHPEELQLWYQILLDAQRDNSINPTPRIGVEMAMLRILAFKRSDTKDFLQEHEERQSGLKQERGGHRQDQQLEQIQKKSDAPALADRDPVPQKTLLMSDSLKALELRNQIALANEKKNDVKEQIVAPWQKITKNIEILTAGKIENQSLDGGKEAEQERASTQTPEEDYQWAWLDPELKLQEQTNIEGGSDKKRALYRAQARLKQQILSLAREDKLCSYIEDFHLAHIAHHFAINCEIVQERENKIRLRSDPKIAVLYESNTHKEVQKIFKHHGIELSFEKAEQSLEGSPSCLYGTIMDSLLKQARLSLIADRQLKMLIERGGFVLDSSSILPLIL